MGWRRPSPNPLGAARLRGLPGGSLLGQGAVHDRRAQHGAVVTSRGCPSPPSALSQGLRGLVHPALLRGRAAGRPRPLFSSPGPPHTSAPCGPDPTPPDCVPQPPAPRPEQEWPLHGCWAPLPTLLRSGPWRVSTEPLGAFPPGLAPPPRPCLPGLLRILMLSQARWPATLEEEALGGAALPRGGELDVSLMVPPQRVRSHEWLHQPVLLGAGLERVLF